MNEMTTTDTILGVYQGYNSNVAVVQAGKPVVVIEKERHSRRRHDRGSIQPLLHMALSRAKCSIHDIGRVVFVGASDLDTNYGYDLESPTGPLEAFPGAPAVRLLSTDCARGHVLRLLDRAIPALAVEHHIAHAAAAFYTSDVDRALVLAFDGWGDFGRSCLVLDGCGSTLRPIESVPLRIGLAFKKAGTHFYRLSGTGHDAAGKLMALAAFGRPKYHEAAALFLDHVDQRTGHRETLLPGLGLLPLGGLRNLESDIARDFAASLQQVATDRVIQLLTRHLAPGQPLCLSGGCALNVKITQHVQQRWPDTRIYVPPCPHDGGLGLGAALYEWHHVRGHPRTAGELSPFLGDADLMELERAELERCGPAWQARFSCDRLPTEALLRRASNSLARNEIVGWCQGRSEIGPRALGHRSILADPSRAEQVERLNRRIKHREHFRPYGLSLREENLPFLFPGAVRSPYMMRAAELSPAWRDRLPAVVHVDHSTRYHTVSRETDQRYWDLLASFESATGIPGILNTSFNTKGEPIAETASDCLSVLADAPVDGLALGDFWLQPRLDTR